MFLSIFEDCEHQIVGITLEMIMQYTNKRYSCLTLEAQRCSYDRHQNSAVNIVLPLQASSWSLLSYKKVLHYVDLLVGSVVPYCITVLMCPCSLIFSFRIVFLIQHAKVWFLTLNSIQTLLSILISVWKSDKSRSTLDCKARLSPFLQYGKPDGGLYFTFLKSLQDLC